MRKVLLVLALIGAAFAGGAVVNGPGLQWAKHLIGEHLRKSDSIPTLDVDGPAVSVDPGSSIASPTPTPSSGSQVAEAAPADPPVHDVPSAPDPILNGTLTRRELPAAKPAPAPQPVASPTLAAAPQPVAEEPPPLSGETAPEPSPLADLPAAAPLKEPAPVSLNGPRTGWEDAPGPAPSTPVLPKAKLVKNSVPASDAAVAAATVHPAPAEPPPLTDSLPSPAAPTPVAPAGWSSLRARMKTLGVSRFWVEGTPDGAVIFRCVVPADSADLANRQFEAEAEDEFKAADSALRRVAVWKAAQRVGKSH